MSQKLILNLLREAQLFRGLNDDACRRLASLSIRRQLARRETLFLEGTGGECFFILITGRIQLQKSTPDGRVVVIRTVRPGEVFAEVVLFESPVYPVTAEALCKSEVCAICRCDLLHLLDERRFRDDWIKMLMNKQRYLADRVRYLMAYDVEERFCIFLNEQYGQQSKFRMEISKQSVAAAISATPETFSRMLGRLKSDGLIKWAAGEVQVDVRFWERHAVLLEEQQQNA